MIPARQDFGNRLFKGRAVQCNTVEGLVEIFQESGFSRIYRDFRRDR